MEPARKDSGAFVDRRASKVKASTEKERVPGKTEFRGGLETKADSDRLAAGVPTDEMMSGVDAAMKRVAEQNETAKVGKAESGDRSAFYKQSGQWAAFPEAGERAVNLAIALNKLKEAQSRDAIQTVRTKGKSQFLAVGQIWVDKQYREGLKEIRVKYLSEGYFDIVAKVPGAKEVLSLGPQIVWKTPSGVALVIDVAGAEKLSDEEWKLLLTVPKPEPSEKKKP